jgi:hypothetical protein
MEMSQVQHLVDEWERVRELTSPLRLSDAPEKQQELAEVSVLSGRRETWGVFVCALGFADNVSQDAHQVLEMAAEQGAERQNVADDFVAFCSDVLSSPREEVEAAANIVYAFVKPSGIKTTLWRMTQLDVCLKLHPDDIEALKKCLASGQEDSD